MTAERLLPCIEVVRQVGISRSRVYALQAAGRFPKPRMIEGRSLWLESEVQTWIADRVASAPVVGTVAGREAAEGQKAA